MVKIGIINCPKTNTNCSGKGCKKAFKERADAFSRYPLMGFKLVRLAHCHGCGDNPVVGVLNEASKMAKKGVKTIHLSSCMKDICIWHNEFIEALSKNFEVVDFTHGNPANK